MLVGTAVTIQTQREVPTTLSFGSLQVFTVSVFTWVVREGWSLDLYSVLGNGWTVTSIFISSGVDGDASDGVQRMANTHRLTPASTKPH